MTRRRRATHAGSWYDSNPAKLTHSLSTWLRDASRSSSLSMSPNGGPVHAVIAPHAGFTYSGPTAAYAYAAVNPSDFSRVIILGPSHHVYLRDRCAVSDAHFLETPCGSLAVDRDVVEGLLEQEDRHARFVKMNSDMDEAEHSIEMQLPYIKYIFGNINVKVVPLIVGSLSQERERAFGRVLSSWIGDGETFFVISSDFCHWGTRFGYTRVDRNMDFIWQGIEKVDKEGMRCIESGSHTSFCNYQRRTDNTICGRHPIGVMMCALAYCSSHSDRTFETQFVKYRQSSRCMSMSDSSVSYASGLIRASQRPSRRH